MFRMWLPIFSNSLLCDVDIGEGVVFRCVIVLSIQGNRGVKYRD